MLCGQRYNPTLVVVCDPVQGPHVPLHHLALHVCMCVHTHVCACSKVGGAAMQHAAVLSCAVSLLLTYRVFVCDEGDGFGDSHRRLQSFRRHLGGSLSYNVTMDTEAL